MLLCACLQVQDIKKKGMNRLLLLHCDSGLKKKKRALSCVAHGTLSLQKTRLAPSANDRQGQGDDAQL